MKSHEIDYKIIGEDIQFVEIELDPNETVIAEAGAMVFIVPPQCLEGKNRSKEAGSILGGLLER